MSGHDSKRIELRDAAGRSHVLILRPLATQDDYERCLALEKVTWGQQFSECVPTSMLMINQKVGGITAGAFTEDGTMAALIYGLAGFYKGRPSHWSHIMAVAAAYKDLGLGIQMKRYQRECLLAAGVDHMRWTYDPLESRNAHLNLNRLGARPIDYVQDIYGPGDTSGLHAGIGTDRFIVYWDLLSERSLALLNDERPAHDLQRWQRAPVVNADASGTPLPGLFEMPDADAVRVAVPANIQAAKLAGPAAGKRWRACARPALAGYIGMGYTDRDFYPDPPPRFSSIRLAPAVPCT